MCHRGVTVHADAVLTTEMKSVDKEGEEMAVGMRVSIVSAPTGRSVPQRAQ
jgi:hypothetical protein